MNRVIPATLLILLFWPLSVVAQVQTGPVPFGTFSGGPDTVDVANLDVQWNIPMIQKAGRGLPFTYGLTYDSSVWYPNSGAWTPVTNFWGWIPTQASVLGYFDTSGVQEQCRAGTTEYYYVSETYQTYYDANGVAHGVGITVPYGKPSQCGSNSGSVTKTLTDGSGLVVQVTYSESATDAVVYTPDGETVNGDNMNTSLYAYDRNGNEISFNACGTNCDQVFTDTLGDTVLTITGAAPSPVTYTYTNPSGQSSSYTVKYTSSYVKTNFGCSGIAEFGPTSEPLITEIDLPDIAANPNDKYTFTYESTPGYSGDVTGRLIKVTLPTGGTISYSYNSITCADGTPQSMDRTTPDGSWEYVHAENGNAWTTTVYDQQNNKTVYDFQGLYQTEEQVYSGSSTLLQTGYTCYNGAAPNCNTYSVSLPITSVANYVEWPSGQESETVVDYNSYSLPTEEDDYDYGSGSPGSLLRKTLTTYASFTNSNIVDKPSSVTVENGSGGTVAETSYSYDQTGVVGTSGTPQQVSITGARGNATTISNLVSSSSTLSKTFTYFDTGNVDVATDVNGAQITYNYPNTTSTCGNAFPASVTEPLNLSRSMTWNCTGAVEASATDENGQTTTSTYSDPNFWRPTGMTDQLNNLTQIAYQDSAPFEVASSMTFNGGNSVTSDIQYKDGLGRTYVDQHLEAPGGSTLDSVSYAFDSNGRLASASGPCAIGYAGTCPGPTTTQTYDSLNRPVLTTDGGTGTLTLSYPGNDVLQQIGPKPTGENLKQRQFEYNGIGQLTSVCELTAGTTLAPAGTCGQTTTETGYWTKYMYDVLGDLLTVNQDAQSSTVQSRSYTYDGLGRMTSETNPETGNSTVYYFYDSDPGTKGGANCSGTYDGDLVKRVDAAGNVTCYSYDALHRTTSATYPYGKNSSNTPSKCFVYDAAIDNQSVTYTKARLAEAYTTTSACSWTNLPATVTDEAFGYTARGESQDIYESTPNSSGYYHVKQTYWANGLPETIGSLTGLPTITYTPDGEGRTNIVSDGSSTNPVTATTYNAASEAKLVSLGSGDNDAFQYDNAFRMSQYQFNINGQSDTGVLNWNPNWSLGGLTITDAFNSANTQTCTYSHDDLQRIASASCGSAFSGTYAYDAFGNLKKSGTYSFQPMYSSSTNQMTSIGSFTPTYDNNGDVTNDDLNIYAWDVEGRPTTINSTIVTYDALERIVEENGATQFVWSPTGARLGFMTGQTFQKAYVPLSGGVYATYKSGGLNLYRHNDWLGSFRLASLPNRTVYFDGAYGPFGETYANSGSAVIPSFTGQSGDTTGSTADLYDFAYREYAIQGRWPSPDPAGTSAANPANPQSWNRYAYVMNNPLALADLLGLNAASVQLPVGCPTAEAVPQSTSQQVAGGGGPFDPGYEAPPPQASSCGLRSNPFNAPSTTWSDGADVTGIFANNPGLFGSGASVGSVIFSGNFIGGVQLGQNSYSWVCGSTTYPSSTPTSITVDGNCSGIVTEVPQLSGLPQSQVDNSDPTKLPLCISVFAKASWNALNPFTPSLASAAEPTTAYLSIQQFNAAWAYAAARPNVLGGTGLIYPLKSSVFRDMLAGAQETAASAPLLNLDLAMAQGLYVELKQAAQGSCRAY